MTNSINISRIGYFGAGILAIFAIFFAFSANKTYAAMTSEIGLGSKSSDVTQLQQFLATNSAIYPSGLVTGYFGPMTEEAVEQFQANYDIAQVGNVGPVTLARMNSVINSGLGLDISAPFISNLNVQTTNQSATVSWNTDSAATGKVFYSTQPLQMSDATMSFTAPYVSGSAVQSNSNGYSQNVTLSNLQSNTTYYYLVQATDASGNVSVSLPSPFHTN